MEKVPIVRMELNATNKYKSIITGASTMSVELAIALLTVIFYGHNKKNFRVKT